MNDSNPIVFLNITHTTYCVNRYTNKKLVMIILNQVTRMVCVV